MILFQIHDTNIFFVTTPFSISCIAALICIIFMSKSVSIYPYYCNHLKIQCLSMWAWTAIPRKALFNRGLCSSKSICQLSSYFYFDFWMAPEELRNIIMMHTQYWYCIFSTLVPTYFSYGWIISLACPSTQRPSMSPVFVFTIRSKFEAAKLFCL